MFTKFKTGMIRDYSFIDLVPTVTSHIINGYWFTICCVTLRNPQYINIEEKEIHIEMWISKGIILYI